jgi:hypothetical protein
MQKVRRHTIKVLRPLVSNWFQVLLTPLTGGLFTFPSRYSYAIDQRVVFSLTQWSAQIHTGFHVSRATQEHSRLFKDFDYGTFTLSGQTFQTVLLSYPMPH